jgi:hypothetical protein
VALILALPWLIAESGPAAGAGRLVPTLLTDLVLAFGLLWAAHQRRAILEARRREVRPPVAPALPALGVAARPTSVARLT